MSKYRFDEIAINSTAKKKPVEEDRFHYIGLEHLDSEDLFVHRYGSEVAPVGEKLIMRKGDVLFGKRRAYQKKVAVAPFDGIFSAHGMVLRPNEKVIDKSFFPFFIASDYFLESAIRLSVGSLSPTINWSDLRKTEFNLPALDRQKTLADTLWAMVETKQAYLDLLRKTDDLVKSQFIEMFGTLGKTKYEIETLGNLCEFIKDGTHQTPSYTDDRISGFKFLSSKDVVTKHICWENIKYIPKELHEVLYSTVKPQRGDLLLAKNGTIGYAAIVDTDEIFDIYVSLALLRFKPGNDIYYLWAAINSAETKNQFDSSLKGIGVPNLHLGEIKKTRIIVPPLSLQKRFSTLIHQTDKSKFALQQTLDALNKTYKKIIAENLG